MKKIFLLLAAVLITAGLVGCSQLLSSDAVENAIDNAVSEAVEKAGDAVDQAGEAVEAIAQEQTETAGEAASAQDEVMTEGLLQGYPSEQVPIMSGAVISEAEPYSDNGFTVEYDIAKPMSEVNAFYQKYVRADPALEDENTIYYDNVELSGVRLAGLTLEAHEGGTAVYITVFVN